MKLIVAGSRYWDSNQTEVFDDYDFVEKKLDKIHASKPITEIVCGKARGADTLGERWAIENDIAVKEFPVTSEDWKRYGKAAGHRRNEEMGDYADAAVIFWNGISKGSLGMKKYMDKLKKPSVVYSFKRN